MNLISLLEKYQSNLDPTSIYAIKSLKDYHRIPLPRIAELLVDWSSDIEGLKLSFFDFYSGKGIFSNSYKSAVSLFEKKLLSHRKQPILRNNAKERILGGGLNNPEIALTNNALLGQQLGRCTIIQKIAEGSSCDVYLAKHQSLGINVAVKIFRNINSYINIDDFRREAQTSARFNHPSFVRILDFDDGLQPHLVLEFVDGYTMSTLIKSSSKIIFDEALKYFTECITALEYLHQKGLAHRDLKPENIMLNKQGEIKISDFGISRFFDKSAMFKNSKTPCGTPLYIAPEQALYPDVIDLRSDIYSLGATYYHILTGQTPFQAENIQSMIMKHINVPIKPPNEINPDIPKDFSDILVKMMAKNTDDRFSSMSALKEELSKMKERQIKPPKRSSTIFRF